MTKRLAAILSADVVGFSRLMGSDETGTFEGMRAYREATDPHIESNGGRIVGTAGDAVLAEFASVRDAVEAAIAMQETTIEFNTDRAPGTEIVYRIGINLGDVMVADDGDIFGDGVNIAARIQAVAPTGGICVSDSVYRSVSRGLDLEFEDLGEQQVKNISDPIRVWSILLPGVVETADGRRTPARNPYKGLHAFKEGDADDFFGRGSLTDRLAASLAEDRRFLAVVGPSGSGKSSVVRAGLIPALRKGAVPGSERWLIAQMVPGAHPFAELEAALLQAAPDSPASLAEQLKDDELGILKAILRIVPDEDSELLLLIDQFEEVFSLVSDETIRQRFLLGIVRAIEARRRLRVVVTMRADFYDGPLLYPDFGLLFTDNMISVMPLGTDELEAALVEPARRAAVSVEPPLVRELINDVASQPGALPLFQYTLTELYTRKEGASLTLDAYHSLGGLRGALTGRADELFAQLGPVEQQAAAQMFLRLVAIRDQGEDSRRRVPIDELDELDVEPAAMRAALDLFGRHRLLTFDRDPISGDSTVEVAHEALLREWSRLREWIEESRGDLRRHTTYVAAVTEWLAADRDPDYLLTGNRLDRNSHWVANTNLSLTATEQEYLSLSVERREAEQAAEAARIREGETLQRRARKRLLAATAVGIVLAGVLAAVLVNALSSSDPRVAVVYRGRDEPAVGAIVAAGLDRAERELGFEIDEIIPITVAADDLRSASDIGDLVITVGNLDGETMLAVGSEFPDVFFAGIDLLADSPQPEQLVRVVFEEQEGSFLVGAAAALKTQTGIIGYVGGIQQDFIEAFRAGYEAGARAVDPDIEILGAYIEGPDGDSRIGFGTPGLGKLTAERLYRRGADIVFHAAGGSGFGVLEAAAEQSDELDRQLWAIGVDADEYLQWSARPDLQTHILTSMLKRWDEGVFAVIERFATDTLEPGVIHLGLTEAGVDYSTSGGFIADIVDQLEALKDQIITGDIEIPRQPSGVLLELLAADPVDDPESAMLLERFVLAMPTGDLETALILLASPDVPGPFGGPARDFFEFSYALSPEVTDLSCEAIVDGAICRYKLFDDLSRALGLGTSDQELTATIEGGLIAGIPSFIGSDDQSVLAVFDWLSETYPETVEEACRTGPSLPCAEFVKLHLEEYVAQL